MVADKLQVQNVEFSIPVAPHSHIAQWLFVHGATVYGKIGVEVGGCVEAIHVEAAADEACNIQLCALQQKFAWQLQVKVVYVKVNVVVVAPTHLQCSLDVLFVAGRFDAFAADFNAMCHS